MAQGTAYEWLLENVNKMSDGIWGNDCNFSLNVIYFSYSIFESWGGGHVRFVQNSIAIKKVIK